MRRLWLALTDPKIRAAMAALDRCGPALGDLTGYPGMAAEFFPPLRQALRRAAAARSKRPGAQAALRAAEEFCDLLARTFADMDRLDARPEAAPEALAFLQRACALAPRLLASEPDGRSLREVLALSASGRRALALARTAADRARDEFPQNLKFSSIYAGFDAAFDAFERCAEALAKV